MKRKLVGHFADGQPGDTSLHLILAMLQFLLIALKLWSLRIDYALTDSFN